MLAAEARAFAARLSDPSTRSRYETLAQAALEGSVPAELVPSVEALLDLVPQRGRHWPSFLLAFSAARHAAESWRKRRTINRARAAKRPAVEQCALELVARRYALVLETDRRLSLVLTTPGRV